MRRGARRSSAVGGRRSSRSPLADAALRRSATLGAMPGAARAECVETVPPGAAAAEDDRRVPRARDERVRGDAARRRRRTARARRVLPRGLELQSDSDAAQGAQGGGLRHPRSGRRRRARGSSSVDLDAEERPRDDDARAAARRAAAASPGGTRSRCRRCPSRSRARAARSPRCARKPHAIVVEDPTASTPDAAAAGRTRPPRPQREEWVALEAAALVGGARRRSSARSLAWLVYRWLQRARSPSPPPPPPRPPWEVALESSTRSRHAGLLETQRFAEYFDRVNDAVREYLGARFGFDGLESTTDEMLAALRRVPRFGAAAPGDRGVPPGVRPREVRDADARRSRSASRRSRDAERIVRSDDAAARRRRAGARAGRRRAVKRRARGREAPGRARDRSACSRSRRRAGARARRRLARARAGWRGRARSASTRRRPTRWRGSRAPAGASLAAALLAVPYVVWRMTLGADARVPRLRVPTIAPLAIGPARLAQRDCATCPACCAARRSCSPSSRSAGRRTCCAARPSDERGIDIVLVLDLSGSMRAVMDAPTDDAAAGRGAPRRTSARRASTRRRTSSSTSSRAERPTASASSSSAKQAYVLVAADARLRRCSTTLVAQDRARRHRRQRTAIGDAVGTARRAPAAERRAQVEGDRPAHRRRLERGRRSRPSTPRTSRRRRACSVYTVQIGNGDDVDVQDGHRSLRPAAATCAQHFPVNPELLKTMAQRDRRRVVRRDRQARASRRACTPSSTSLEKTKFEAQAATMEDLFPFLLVPGGAARSRSRRSCALAARPEVPVRFGHDFASLSGVLVAVLCARRARRLRGRCSRGVVRAAARAATRVRRARARRRSS